MDHSPIVLFKKLSEHAITPTRVTPLSAGLDLFSPTYCVVKTKSSKLIPLDIQLQLPVGFFGQIAPKSGLALNNFIDVGAGIIDTDFTGNISVLLFNFSDIDFYISRGKPIAQLLVQPIAYPALMECQSLPQNNRTLGFGEMDKDD